MYYGRAPAWRSRPALSQLPAQGRTLPLRSGPHPPPGARAGLAELAQQCHLGIPMGTGS